MFRLDHHRHMTRLLFSLILLAASAGLQAKTLLVLGDSLSAGYGMDTEQSWVQLLRERIAPEGEHKVINASVSGETSGGGLARLPALLAEHKPDLVILELGGNDGLRGHPVKSIKRNLSAMTELSRKSGAEVLLLGMRIPPNYGARYTQAFAAAYPAVAEAENVPLVPFFLDEVAVNSKLMQEDGIHPKAVAQTQLLENVLPHLMPLL